MMVIYLQFTLSLIASNRNLLTMEKYIVVITSRNYLSSIV